MPTLRNFKLTETELDSGQREVAVVGELDLAVAEQLQEALARSRDVDTLVDLGACEFIDSTGIAVLIKAHQEAEATGRMLKIHSPTAQVLRVFTVTGLTDNGLVFESRETALSRSSAAG